MPARRSRDHRHFRSFLMQRGIIEPELRGYRAASHAANLAVQALLQHLHELPVGSSGLAAKRLSDLYESGQDRQVPRPTASEGRFALPRLEALVRDLTVEELLKLRRSLARANHPDLASPGLQAHATRRMALANMLIDRALSKRRAAQK